MNKSIQLSIALSMCMVLALMNGIVVGSVVSTFDTDAAGWVIREVTVAEVVQGEWTAYWNSPGYVYSPDVGDYTFCAPSKFLGDKSAYIGGSISFDMMNNLADYDTASGTYWNLMIVGGGITLFHDGDYPQQANVWTHADASLNYESWYKHWDKNDQATATEFSTVLENLEGIYVYADWGWGSDTSYLDNVVMQVPEPATLSLLGLGGLLLRRRKSGEIKGSGTFSGKIGKQVHSLVFPWPSFCGEGNKLKVSRELKGSSLFF